ncbi:MAG: glycine/sarcosine/betaine reductase selenoprotein B family protein [Acidimicrobiia bacterium]
MDSYRYLPFMSRRVMQAWAEREQPPDQVSWTALTKPLSRCRVALISTAGIALRSDRPFDQQGERDDPWWGDPTWRALPVEAPETDTEIYHLHIDTEPARRDLNVVLPRRRLQELAEQGTIGEASPRHFSIMGYLLDTSEVTSVTAPALASALHDDDVDLVLLVPV